MGAQAPGSPAQAAEALCQRYQAELAARGFEADAAQRRALEHLAGLRARLIAAAARPAPWYARLLPRRTQPAARGLYLWGGVGRGKTWLMDLFCDSLPLPKRRAHFHRFMHDVHAQLKQLPAQRAPLESVAATLAREARVLCFDELYVADIADAMILGTLFAALFRRGVTLVATSNVPPAELYRDGLQRARFLPAIALLQEHCEVLKVDGPTDYRLRRLRHAGTYLEAGSPTAAARMEALFAELGGGTVQQGGTLEIEARPIPVVRLAHGAVWFEFADLCGPGRSQEDYIEIAREFQSVFLAHVPLLGPESEDAARRFIALVDELYDRNVNLIVSAAAAPAQLYRGERLGALFERTASRLTEMQSAAYLAREHWA